MPRAIKAANSGTSTSRWSSIITKRRTRLASASVTANAASLPCRLTHEMNVRVGKIVLRRGDVGGFSYEQWSPMEMMGGGLTSKRAG